MAASSFGRSFERDTLDYSIGSSFGQDTKIGDYSVGKAASDATGGTSSRPGSRPASGLAGGKELYNRPASRFSNNSVERGESFEEPAAVKSETVVSEGPPEDEAAIQPYNQESQQESVSPKNEQVWAASTKTMLGKAKSLRQAAEGELAKTTVDWHEGKQKSEAMGNKNQSQLRKKIDTTHSIARSLWDRTTGTEDTIRHVGHSIFQLNRAQQATSTPLDVITKCIELRKARPLQELVYDHFQKALEEEQAALQFSQKAYQERVDISRGILQELEEAKGLLRSDMLQKRQASRYTPAPGQAPGQATERGGPGPRSPSAAGCSSTHDRTQGPPSFDTFGQSFGTFEDPCPPHTFAVEPLACPAHGYNFNMNCKLCQRSLDNAEEEKLEKEADWREREAEKRAGRSLPRMPESSPGQGGRYTQSPVPHMSSAYAQTDVEGVGAKNAKTPRPQSAGQYGQCRAVATRLGPGDPGCHAQQLLAHTHELCSTAARICSRNEEVLKDRRRDCELTRKSVVENMRKRMLETSELKKALEQEIRETDSAIGGMGDGLAETERQCSIHNVALDGEPNKGEPGPVLLRKQRADGERKGVGRPPEKDEPPTVSNVNIRALQEQYKRKRTVLEQMSMVRHQLGDDLRCKVQAFNIDSQCSKLLTRPHTARVGVGPSPPAQAKNGKPPFRRKGNNGVVISRGMAATWGPGSDDW